MATKRRPISAAPETQAPSASSKRARSVQDTSQCTILDDEAYPFPLLSLSPPPSSSSSLCDISFWDSLTEEDAQLIAHVQDLPQEPWCKVLFYVFVAGESEIVVDPSYRPPQLLAVNRLFRKMHAESYYKGLTAKFNPGNDLMAMTWLKSLPKKHRNMLKEVKLIRSVTITHHTGGNLENYMRFRRSMMWKQLFDWIQYSVPREWKHHIQEAIRFEEHVRTPDGKLHIIRV
jgi:hypothetical protein